jgi:hypothetical protein
MAVTGTSEAPLTDMTPSPQRPVFLLGVGCQKGGTTWLHAELTKCPHVDMGFTKEYHIFDGLYISGCDDKLRERQQKLRTRLGSGALVSGDQSARLLKLIGFHVEIDLYYNYFQFLALRDPSVRLVGDITPAYAGLPVEALRAIRSELRARGFHVKVVFLMRDPFERLWSIVRHIRRKRGARHPRIRFAQSEAAFLLDKAGDQRVRFKTDYRLTVANLEAVFPPEDILYGFYEALFTVEAATRIGDFLGIAFQPDFMARVNASPKLAGDLPVDTIAKVVQEYRDVYSFCDQRFPEAGLRELWQGFRYLS